MNHITGITQLKSVGQDAACRYDVVKPVFMLPDQLLAPLLFPQEETSTLES